MRDVGPFYSATMRARAIRRDRYSQEGKENFVIYLMFIDVFV